MGGAGLGDGHGEGAEQSVAQGDIGALTQAVLESLQGGIQAQAAQQPASDGADNQRHDYVYAAQAQDEHYCNRNDHCIHGYVLFERSIARGRARTLPDGSGAVKSSG